MIAISYRREDSLPIAGRLYDRLQGEFGKGNVFMDFDSIPYGVDFREHIKEMIDRSKVLVAIIGPDWFGKRRQRTRRIDDPTDFVRLEIAYALQRGIPVIPVLIDKMLMPKASDLPADIEALAFRNAVSLDIGIDFHHHVDRLVVGIDRLVHEARKSASLATDKIPDIPRQPQMPLTPGLFQEPPFPKQTSTPPPLPPKPPVPEETESTPLPTLTSIIRTPKRSEATHEITNQPPPLYAVWLKHLQSGIAQAHASITRLQLPKRKLVYGAIGLLAIIVAITISFWEFPKRETVPQEIERPSLPEAVPFREQNPTKIKPETTTPAPTPETILGSIEINSSPVGQTFELIDAASNHRTGTTPSVFTDIPTGYTEIIYKKDGVQEHRETVFVSADKTASATWTYPEQTSEPAVTIVKPEPRNNRTWQAWIDEFVKQFVATSQQDTDVHLAFYGSDVFYFDSPHKDQAYIRQDVEKYRERWPVRYESLEGDIHLNEQKPDQEYTADFKLNFYAESPTRNERSKGQCVIDISMTIIDGVPKISAIKQKFLWRKKSTALATASSPVETTRNSFGIIEGSYICQYLKTSRTRHLRDKFSDQRKEVGTVTYGSRFVIEGTRFSYFFSLHQEPTTAGVREWPVMNYTIRTDGDISPNGPGVFLLKPDRVELVEKFPKNLADSNTSITRDRQRLPDTKWIVRYEETNFVQTSDGETWNLENKDHQ